MQNAVLFASYLRAYVDPNVPYFVSTLPAFHDSRNLTKYNKVIVYYKSLESSLEKKVPN